MLRDLNTQSYTGLGGATAQIPLNMGHVINIKGKGISFIKQLSCKLSIMDFY